MVEMCAVPLFSQNTMFKDWRFTFDCWSRKFDTWPLGDVLDKTIWMLEKPHRPKDREDGGLVGGRVE